MANSITQGLGPTTVAGPPPTQFSGQTGAVAAVASWTVGGSDGSFLVVANVLPTTIGSGNFTVTVAYTDESNTPRTLTITFWLVGGGSTSSTVNTAAPYHGHPYYLRCKAGTTITIATTGTFTGCTYDVNGLILQVG